MKKGREKNRVEIGGVVRLKRRSLTPSHSVQSSLSRVSHTMTHRKKELKTGPLDLDENK